MTNNKTAPKKEVAKKTAHASRGRNLSREQMYEIAKKSVISTWAQFPNTMKRLADE